MISTGLFADHALSQRLERAEGMANASYIDARARLSSHSEATWIDVAGTYAMFDTPDSPVTQTFGLGMFGAVAPVDLDQLEAFFTERLAPVHHEISPFADPSVWPLIARRGYTPYEFTSILYLDLRGALPAPADSDNGLTVRPGTFGEHDLWARTAAAGWGQPPELAGFMETAFSAEGVTAFFAEKDGMAVATGALNIQNGVGLLAGASTIPQARGQGAQRALLAVRLRFAAKAGCKIASMGAQPGSASQRNAERTGFHVAYTRIKWRLDLVGNAG